MSLPIERRHYLPTAGLYIYIQRWYRVAVIELLTTVGQIQFHLFSDSVC